MGLQKNSKANPDLFAMLRICIVEQQCRYEYHTIQLLVRLIISMIVFSYEF